MILMLVIRLAFIGRFSALIVGPVRATGKRRGGIGTAYRSRYQHLSAIWRCLPPKIWEPESLSRIRPP
jgi:hypothetical protein